MDRTTQYFSYSYEFNIKIFNFFRQRFDTSFGNNICYQISVTKQKQKKNINFLKIIIIYFKVIFYSESLDESDVLTAF